ncbi:MAG: hypothetical protein NC409_05670 [Clostridium sp.]|nr:hypothetical protein [Clostridium sp.]
MITDSGAYLDLTREEGEQSGNGYVKEKQMFFDFSAETDRQLSSKEFSVLSGEYRVTLYCDEGEWGDSSVYAYSYGNAYSLKSEQVQCDSSSRKKSFSLIASHSINDLQIRFNLETTGFTIAKTVIERIDRTGALVCRYLLLDGVLMILWGLSGYFEKKQLVSEQCIAYAIMGVGLVIAILPELGNGILTGTDLEFHLWRIEAVKQGISSGDLNPKIYTNLLNGYGYASGVLYGDSLLYFPAVLRMAGLTVSGAYRVFVIILTMFTMGICYYVFCVTSGGCYMIAACCSVLYVLSAPHIMTIHENAGVGAACASMFLPLVFGSLWLLWKEEKRSTKAECWLVIGATGLIQSHIISTFVTALVAAGIILLGFRRYFRKNQFLSLFRSAVWILLLNASFLIPFMDYYLTTRLKINTLDGTAMIQYTGADVQQLSQYHRFGDLSWLYLTLLGIGVLSMMGLYVAYRIWLKIKGKHAGDFENIIWIGCITSLLLCTCYFPWDYLSKQSGLINKIANSIQFPFRFRNVMLILLLMLVAIMLKAVYQKSRIVCIGEIVVMLLITVVGGLQVYDAIYEQNTRTIYIEETGMRTGFRFQIGDGGEYLPAGVSLDIADTQIIDEQQIVERFERMQNRFLVEICNQNQEESIIELPILYYKGYVAYDVDTGESVAADMGTSGRVRVRVPAGYQGTIRVEFRDVWYWNAAEMITALGWMGYVLMGIRTETWKNWYKKLGKIGNMIKYAYKRGRNE